MSLKDLLPEGTYDEITTELEHSGVKTENKLIVRCPQCGKIIKYDTNNPYRPFCSQRCRILDLGAWANEERVIKGRPVNDDEDADLLNDPNLPKRHVPED